MAQAARAASSAAAGLIALTPFHALLLPRVAAARSPGPDGTASLARPYAWEVIGGLAALGLAAALPAARIDTLLAVNLVAMLATLGLRESYGTDLEFNEE